MSQRDRRIAYHHRQGTEPTILFLPGYGSDMEGTKALALDQWAQQQGRAYIRFDYGGCGASSGDFEAQTLVDWRDDAIAMIDDVAQGRVLLVGSSMGGWLMLHAAMARPDRVAGLVGIAAAPDFTHWGYTQEQKVAIRDQGRLELPSPYSDQPSVISRAFWERGDSMRLLHAEIPIDCPVHLLHGQLDQDVPWTYALELMKLLRSASVQTTIVKDGDHRLSREADIALLIGTVRTMLEAL